MMYHTISQHELLYVVLFRQLVPLPVWKCHFPHLLPAHLRGRMDQQVSASADGTRTVGVSTHRSSYFASMADAERGFALSPSAAVLQRKSLHTHTRPAQRPSGCIRSEGQTSCEDVTHLLSPLHVNW